MTFKFWPFNKSKKEEELKRKKRKIIIWCSSIGSIAVLAGGGTGLYFALKPKSSGGNGDGGDDGDNWFPKGATKLTDCNGNTDLSNQYFVCPKPIWNAAPDQTGNHDSEAFLKAAGSQRAQFGSMYFYRRNWDFSENGGEEGIVVNNSQSAVLGWRISGGVPTEESTYFSTGLVNKNEIYYVHLNLGRWPNAKYNDITGGTDNQSFDEWLQKCYFVSTQPS